MAWRSKRLRATTVTVLAYQFPVDDEGFLQGDVLEDVDAILRSIPNNYEWVETFEPEPEMVQADVGTPAPIDDAPPSDDPTFGVQRSHPLPETPRQKRIKGRR